MKVSEQVKNGPGQGFDNQTPVPSGKGTNGSRDNATALHPQVRAGLANTSTAHAQFTANLLEDARDFQSKLGERLGQEAVGIAQGKPFLQSFVATLNAGLAEQGPPKVESFPDVDEFIASLSLDSPAPDIRPRFYLEPVFVEAES